MHSSGNLFQSFTTLCENVYFLISNLEWHFTKARLCPLDTPRIDALFKKTSIWLPRIRLVSTVINL